MNERRDRGLALILVMTVVLALAIIATPFVLSMILQERSGTAARYVSQAEFGADGAKNYALWRLMPSNDYYERRNPSGLASSYTYDTDQEIDVRLDEDPLRSKLKVSDPKGSIWGVTVQDEQGKLNTRTCNPNALENLSRMVDARVVNLKDYLTLYSGRDATWVCPQRIRQQGFNRGTPGGGITVDNLFVLGPQSRVRVSKSGMRPFETRITGNALLGSGGQDGFST
jgi:Tfp pilus assembly protein PilX